MLAASSWSSALLAAQGNARYAASGKIAGAGMTRSSVQALGCLQAPGKQQAEAWTLNFGSGVDHG